MTHKSPLATLDLSDDRQLPNDFLTAKLAETRRELLNTYERVDQLRDGVRGLLGLLVLIGNRPDVTPELRKVLLTNHRVLDAQEVLL